MPIVTDIEQGKALVVKTFEGVEVVPQEEWEALVEDCKAILTESINNVRESIIKMKWELGDRLFKCGEERIRGHLEKLAAILRISERELYHCLAFRSKFPRLNEIWEQLPEGKNISWHKLINNYLDFTIPKPIVPIEEKVYQLMDTDLYICHLILTI